MFYCNFHCLFHLSILLNFLSAPRPIDRAARLLPDADATSSPPVKSLRPLPLSLPVGLRDRASRKHGDISQAASEARCPISASFALRPSARRDARWCLGFQRLHIPCAIAG